MSEADRHGEAILGIQLAQHPRQGLGAPPNDEELAQLTEGTLTPQRRSEVLSHLASNPTLYRQWQDVSAMAETPQTQPTSLLATLTHGLNNWLIDWRYAVGGLATLAVVTVLFGQLTPTPQPPPAETGQFDDFAAAPAESMTSSEASAPQGSAPASQKAERELSSRMAMEHAEELQASASIAPPVELSRRCISLPHPISRRAGLLCAVALENGVSELRWQARDTAEVVRLDDLYAPVLELKTSADGQWLALQTTQAINVQQLKNLFGDNTERAQLPFNASTATLRWDKNSLIISVLQALGDSDDDQTYHYHPETGELKKSE